MGEIFQNRKLPDALNETVNDYWTRYCEAIGHLQDEGLRNEIQQICSSRTELNTVWAGSDFVANTCIARPQLLFELIESGDLDDPGTPQSLQKRINEFIGNCADSSELHTRLRKIRQREMVRLAWRDLSGFADLDEIMQSVSVIGENCIELALSHHHKWLTQHYGQPRNENGSPSNMVVLGLGKLGGKELNYSSDVDLIFAYNGTGKTVVTNKDTEKNLEIDNQEYFIRLGQKIISALDPMTEDGFVFRTDMRLRPNGDSGPLALSFGAMEHYYQTHGRNWERYALIKARVVAGDREAGGKLLKILKPFVYRKYLDFSTFDSIREMKSMIERELKQKGLNENIKLGYGGIREVEFLVQSHQLIRGGREKNLRTNSLYEAMSCLEKIGVMEKLVGDQLLESYRFLRNSEHRLQMVSDQQTQQLPEMEYEQLRLAWGMGFENWNTYLQQLNAHRENIHKQFKLILDGDSSPSITMPMSSCQLVDVWNGGLSQDNAEKTLLEAGFSSASTTPGFLREFREGRLYQAFSNVERDRIDRLIPLALQQAAQHAEPERAIAAFISVIESIGRRSVYLSLLIENPIALKQLLHLCAASPWISSHIGLHPVILDELLSPLVDIRNRSDEDIQLELDYRLEQIPRDDEEGRMNTLREFNHAQVLCIAAADVSGVLQVADIHHALTLLGEVLLQNVFNDAVNFVENKMGPAPCDAGVIAYGKFASGELGYHSDLDVVVCYELPDTDNSISNNDAEHFFSRVGRRLIHLLTTRTQAGILYELDMRLRPSGRSGTLVSSLSGFFDYQIKSAWTWEHQALIRSRVVVGKENFGIKFELARKAILSMEREVESLKADIIAMRRKMIDNNCQSTNEVYDIKLGEGGIVDIEFLIQYWILKNANEHIDLVIPRATGKCLEVLVKSSIIDEEISSQLLRCYQTYLRHSLDLKLMKKPVLTPQNMLLEERNIIMSIWSDVLD